VDFAFEHPVWRELRLIPCVLTEQFRQNQDPLLDILTEIRTGQISTRSQDLLASRNIAVETEDHTELFTRNISVDKYNTDRLNAIREDIFVFEMQGK
jgi:hypothetical protein